MPLGSPTPLRILAWRIYSTQERQREEKADWVDCKVHEVIPSVANLMAEFDSNSADLRKNAPPSRQDIVFHCAKLPRIPGMVKDQ